MSTTAKTLGILLIGLVGLLVYVGIYVMGQIGYSSVLAGADGGIGTAIASGVTYVGLALTAAMLLLVVVLTAGRVED